ncbi:C-terminal helicase domain-containing protein [Mucilaginibacter gilvus]|nr:C-terminal helicase domain-containing protein [Mucilaginibacter gilvus]
MKDDSFSNPKTTPHPFKIHKLLIQYRSLVPIGSLFSHYRYGGLLTHARTEAAISKNKDLAPAPITIKSLPLSTINIVHFPVKKYGGIFRSRTIKGSPYQIYAAIFSVELIRYIQQNVTLAEGEVYRIGIISPYAIQSTLISKLLEKIGSGNVEVISGTVHGFQGDECNLVIVVLNPPRNITRSLRSFLNKKNILNVAISRARDKMIFLTPYDPENELNLNDLHQIRWIERLAGKLEDCKGAVAGYDATEIEKSLWGNKNHIEDITFATIHQNVNIYTEALKMYELRHDDNAIDVQVKINKRNNDINI